MLLIESMDVKLVDKKDWQYYVILCMQIYEKW